MLPDVSNMCGIMGLETFLLKAHIHIMCMPDSRISKQVFFGQLA